MIILVLVAPKLLTLHLGFSIASALAIRLAAYSSDSVRSTTQIVIHWLVTCDLRSLPFDSHFVLVTSHADGTHYSHTYDLVCSTALAADHAKNF